MSRPIDADALMHILESCRDTAPILGLQSIIAIDDAIQMVIDAPTIPAIPVEWLREKMQKPQTTCANPFGFVLAEWLEEQEGR